ncbi:MAG: hypothetical protein P8Z81_11265, partial [Deinococcales bacterium]
PFALNLTLTDPNLLQDFVALLTSGGDNTAQITLRAGSSDPVFKSPTDAGLVLTFGSGSVVFGY